ncbi:helix-turn-helix domain-containing protein [Timonella senegalensis]|uniref:helix-turn-helix domain-containing protein n=1 Tax=Timonella senegalensis TaxID=1465825 RepID=UPI0002D6F738|nr:helix-turn-helix transcriptional regulator [Timonella senegalensis]
MMKPWYRARTPELLGAAVTGAREDSHLTQTELAEHIDSSRPTLSRLESGKNSSTITLLNALAACGYEVIAVPRGSKITVTPPASAPTRPTQPTPPHTEDH